jgi:hypothetical protein
MSSDPIYSQQQERQLFDQTLRSLWPENIFLDNVEFQLPTFEGHVPDEEWTRWTKLAGGLLKRQQTSDLEQAHPFYRSLGFFSLGDPSHSIRGFMINPQSAFNTISGLLDTRSRDDVPKSMHAVFRDLPWLQPAFGVQRQR